MYFFLSHRAFSDLCYSSAVGPKMLVVLLTKSKSIPFIGCALQFFFYMFVYVECLLLALMAFDWYKAISNPLLYAADMSSRLCSVPVASIYLLRVVDSLIHTSLAFCLCFFGPKMLSDLIAENKSVPSAGCALNFFFTCVFISAECVLLMVMALDRYQAISSPCCKPWTHPAGCITSSIITTIFKMNSAEGKRKASSTCSFHPAAVAVFHGNLLFMYFHLSSSYSMDTDKMASVFYMVVIQMLNSLIYRLRNKDVKAGLKQGMSTTWCSGQNHLSIQNGLKIQRINFKYLLVVAHQSNLQDIFHDLLCCLY
ncbi:Olfactory receptor 5W2 [Heterocephalus glaber]|uniref:Olfactory receptor n=1 Tax=Heterocephalus glaber TaxID=10181 RepID=G5CAV6_HETGA|nr:Olfactory receptor 5W2 [Heterocephalus glaber]